MLSDEYGQDHSEDREDEDGANEDEECHPWLPQFMMSGCMIRRFDAEGWLSEAWAGEFLIRFSV